jgi:hypothetical protein
VTTAVQSTGQPTLSTTDPAAVSTTAKPSTTLSPSQQLHERVRGQQATTTTTPETRFRTACKEFDYRAWSKNPDAFENNVYHVTGRIDQVAYAHGEDGTEWTDLVVDMHKYNGKWIDPVFVDFKGWDYHSEGTMVSVYGDYYGTIVVDDPHADAKVTIPRIGAQYVDYGS